MTYCLGVKTKEGLIGIADTRITSGNETTTSKKVFVLNRNHHSLFIMTSGLRSVRDKALTYFNEILEEKDQTFTKLYKAVNEFATQVRRVAKEDKEPLSEAGLDFNLNALVGGQLEDDDQHRLFMLYPQGNWVEVGMATPYFIIGNTGYGKPILDRSLKYDSSMQFALKCGFLSFDATRISANDVDFPLDVTLYRKDSYEIKEKRYSKDDLQHVSDTWNRTVTGAIDSLPDEWTADILRGSKSRQINIQQ